MSIHNSKQVLVFWLIAGLGIYLLNALWSAIFIVSVPMDPNWCTDSVEYSSGEHGTEWQCVEFKDELEQRKYFHNQKMRQRNEYWVYGMIAFGGLLGLTVFYTGPKWRGDDVDSEDFILSIVVGATAALVAPLILGWLLPAPANWFPSEITEIANMKQEEALRRLRESVNR